MDVFNVIDHDGNKIRDKEVIDYIQRVGTIILVSFSLNILFTLTIWLVSERGSH
ncbi:hypothetical protein CJ030_MR6G006599 [Morella rubra]|uniref:Uncharacterized protein n=1 Tax=Morella rubra TaxID=262757 RepID=A0A6A1VGH0_9ROSI|nr:hypothetical protein CJ030_MR6G006599 [Morella rubra]